jgi:hypothetical protein
MERLVKRTAVLFWGGSYCSTHYVLALHSFLYLICLRNVICMDIFRKVGGCFNITDAAVTTALVCLLYQVPHLQESETEGKKTIDVYYLAVQIIRCQGAYRVTFDVRAACRTSFQREKAAGVVQSVPSMHGTAACKSKHS